MSPGLIALGVVMAILAFWVVGAYNRLLRLRNAAAKAYAACDVVLVERIAASQRLCDALEAGGHPGREFVELARAAARQAAQACDAARVRPLMRRTMVKVSMALLVLDGALETLRRTALRAALASAPGMPVADVTAVDDGARAAAAMEGAPADVPGGAPEAAPASGPAATGTSASAEGAMGGQAPAAQADDRIDSAVQTLAALGPRWDLAQTQYDQAASDYNAAAAQFPTRLVALLFSLHPAQGLAPHWSDTLSATLAPPG